MGVSFKVAKVGTRYRPKFLQIEGKETENGTGNHPQEELNEGKFDLIEDKVINHSNESAESALHPLSEDLEVSFSLNLFLDGFSVGKPAEHFNDVPKQLLPYDRSSEALFTAIEYGWLPGDIFDQIPCKYVNGAVLCEIRDYRNCFSQRALTALAETSPTIHKVLLQMCMENVVKDILSISNECWTYEVLLEVESRILNALQPDLDLNPNPLLDRFCREALTKKINLGIPWGWKKRKLSDAPKCNSQHVICTPSIGGIHDSNPQSDLTYHSRELTTSQKNISRAVPSSKVGKVALENISQLNPSTLKHNYQLVDGCNKSATTNLPSSATNSSRDQREPPLLVPAERSGHETQTIGEGPIFKKPKQGPVDFTELPGQAEIILAPMKNNQLFQQVEAEKIINGKYSDRRGFFSLINKGQQEIPEGNSKLPTGITNFTVKQEVTEATDLNNSDVRKKDVRSNQSNVQQQLAQKSPSLLRANSHPSDTVDKNLRNENGTKNRKNLFSPQATTDARTASLRLFLGESLPREASVPAKQRNNICSRGLTRKTIDSLASTNFESFVKIGRVTQRYKLNDRKRKLDLQLQSKSFFHAAHVAFHLANSEDRRLKNANIDRIPLSKCFVDRKLNVSKTRTLTFIHRAYVHQRNEIYQVDSGAQIKLIMSEMLNEGKVEATVVYGPEEKNGSISFPLPLTFPNIHFADLFAAQFQSLVVNEGYLIARDHIEIRGLSSDGELSSQHPTITGSDTATCRSLPLSSQTLIPGSSTSTLSHMTSRMPVHTLSHMTSRMPVHDPRPLSSQNILSRSHLLHPVNFQSDQQILPSNLAKLQFDFAAQISPMNLQWPKILNKRAHLQFQMMGRQRQQEQLMQKGAMVGGLGATMGGVGTMQLGGQIWGQGDSVVALEGFMNSPQRGQMPWTSNLDQFNSLDGNMSSWNERKHLSMMLDHPASFLSKLGLVPLQGQGGDMMNRIPIHGSTGVVQMQRPTIPDMAYLLNNQHLSHPQQLQMPYSQQQEMVSLLQPAEATILGEHMSSSMSNVRPNRFDELHQMGPLQLSTRSALQQTNDGNAMVGLEIPELTSTPGSMLFSNASS